MPPELAMCNNKYAVRQLESRFNTWTKNCCAVVCYFYAKGWNSGISKGHTKLRKLQRQGGMVWNLANEMLQYIVQHYPVLDEGRSDPMYMELTENVILDASLKSFLDSEVARIQKGGFGVQRIMERTTETANSLDVEGVFFPHAILIDIMSTRVKKKFQRATYPFLTDAEFNMLKNNPLKVGY